MWSEEEMCEIPDPPRPTSQGTRARVSQLRQELAGRNFARAATLPHELTRSSVVYAPEAGRHGNFIEASYRRILTRPDWSARLQKVHTGKRLARPTGPDEETRAWAELDTATSSDALLMNVFCYPRVLAGKRLQTLLGIGPGVAMEFGYRPDVPTLAAKGTLSDRSEVDLRLGSLLLEAKLTEADFQSAPLRLVERYAGFDEVFDRELLAIERSRVQSYQLIRGVLAAHAEGARFAVLLDARRPDLVEAWYRVIRAVRSFELQGRLRVLTWQEIAGTTPGPLRDFLGVKYGIFGGER